MKNQSSGKFLGFILVTRIVQLDSITLHENHEDYVTLSENGFNIIDSVSPDTYCSAVSYFCMIFAAGLGVGLFYFGVGETVQHYAPKDNVNRITYR